MKQISNADYASVIRLLEYFSAPRGRDVRERENARRAALLERKLKRKDGQGRTH